MKIKYLFVVLISPLLLLTTCKAESNETGLEKTEDFVKKEIAKPNTEVRNAERNTSLEDAEEMEVTPKKASKKFQTTSVDSPKQKVLPPSKPDVKAENTKSNGNSNSRELIDDLELKSEDTSIVIQPKTNNKAEDENTKQNEEIVKNDEAIPENKIDQASSYIEELDRILKKFVDAKGNVNYSGMKASQASLNATLERMSANAPKDSWSRNEKLAYWINLYNGYTLKLIVDNYPLKSITDLEGGKPWDKVWIKAGSETLSLNNIENDIIRPRFNDARIHFAVNCAAASCPPLLNAAFKPLSLEQQLESQTKKFLNNSAYNQISGNTIKVSKIFEWYGVDFGDVKGYIAKYTLKDLSQAQIQFKEYDWALNQQ